MATLKEISGGRRDVFMVDPRKIKVEEGWNGRSEKTMGDIEGLAQQIIELGFLPDKALRIKQVGDEIFLRSGHRRLAATLLAIQKGHDIQLVPCVPQARGQSEAEELLSMLADNDGKPFEPWEEANVIRRLINTCGLNMSDVARKLGKSVPYVEGRLSFLEANPELQEAAKNGSVSVSTVQKASKLSKDKQKEIAAKAKKGEKVGVKHVQKAANGHADMVSIRRIANWVKKQTQELGEDNARVKHWNQMLEAIKEIA